jgi:hypothetical protein
MVKFEICLNFKNSSDFQVAYIRKRIVQKKVERSKKKLNRKENQESRKYMATRDRLILHLDSGLINSKISELTITFGIA